MGVGCLVFIGIGKLYPRSIVGSIYRIFCGEGVSQQSVNDLAVDLSAHGGFEDIRSWADNLLARLKSGTVRTNENPWDFWPTNMYTVDPSEIPGFIKKDWRYPPNFGYLVSVAQEPQAVIIWWPEGRGIIIGPTQYKLPNFLYQRELRPGIYLYFNPGK